MTFKDGSSCTFMGDGCALQLAARLSEHDYSSSELCDCEGEFTVESSILSLPITVNLTQGFARSQKAQTTLSNEEIELFSEIIEWAREHTGDQLVFGDKW